jgi:monofunctional biosynthetic peptidoglycan transglycosylase
MVIRTSVLVDQIQSVQQCVYGHAPGAHAGHRPGCRVAISLGRLPQDIEQLEARLDRRIVAGGSTISQQLAKNLFLSTKRTPWRKAEEAAITVMLETVMDKQRIFELYLNVIEWGNGVFGAEAAAQHYYHVHASQLSADQAAKLAAMVPNPRYYGQHREAAGLQRKTGIILGRMGDADIPE